MFILLKKKIDYFSFFIHLKEPEKENKQYLLATDWFFKCPEHLGLGQIETRNLELNLISRMYDRSQARGPSSAASQDVLAAEWIQASAIIVACISNLCLFGQIF